MPALTVLLSGGGCTAGAGAAGAECRASAAGAMMSLAVHQKGRQAAAAAGAVPALVQLLLPAAGPAARENAAGALLNMAGKARGGCCC